MMGLVTIDTSQERINLVQTLFTPSRLTPIVIPGWNYGNPKLYLIPLLLVADKY